MARGLSWAETTATRAAIIERMRRMFLYWLLDWINGEIYE
jgi:hypothetical protein